MQTWLKYVISFFALSLILTGFIFAFGPASTRQAFRSGEMQTGQLDSNAHLASPGEPMPTTSGTTRPADGLTTQIGPAQKGSISVKTETR